MNPTIDYANKHFDRFLEELKDYLRIPSISTLPDYSAEMRRAADWTVNKLQEIGMENVELVETAGHPIVYGDWLHADDAPTVLIYGHYDVQPADPLDAWDHDPFDPVIRDNHIVARGSADDKGQVFINLAAIESIMSVSGKLPINVRFVIEGEEEVGSAGLDHFIQTETERVSADVIVISDTTMLSLQQPAISTSFRGGVYIEVEVQGPSFDLHSGQHGGVVHNPIQALSEIISLLHNPDGSVNIPGFYQNVQSISPDEKAHLATLYNEEEFRLETGAPQSWGETDYNLRERIVARPTLELCGIFGGWTGEGRKTVLPSKAIAKISCRLVPDQDPNEIEAMLRARIIELAPKTVKITIRSLGISYPIYIDTENPAIQIAVEAYEKGFEIKPIFMRKGGSLPIISTFKQVMNAPIVLAGYGLPSDRVHGPNERFHLECFRRGIYTAINLYQGLKEYKVQD